MEIHIIGMCIVIDCLGEVTRRMSDFLGSTTMLLGLGYGYRIRVRIRILYDNFGILGYVDMILILDTGTGIRHKYT